MTFDKQGRLLRPEEFEQAASLNAPDVVVFSHGWLNDRARADELYSYYRAHLAPMPVVGVYWPSKPGAAAGLVKAGVDNASYYVMKERAGTVGAQGLAPALARLKALRPAMRIHLAGHSFGARLVAAAVAALEPGAVESLTLIQAAFSQSGFAPGGGFRHVVEPRRLASPVIVTRSKHDLAVGLGYAIASRVARQNASSLIGGAEDPYGGMGRNGASGAPVVPITDEAGLFAKWSEPVVNIEASDVFQSHTDILKPQMAELIRRVAAGVRAPQWGH